MPYCPNCGQEYRDGYKRCADCGEPLLDTPQQARQVQQERARAMQKTLLVSTIDDIQTGMVVAALHQQGIPVVINGKELGAVVRVYTGYSMLGDELYVDAGDYDRALEVLAGIALPTDAKDRLEEFDWPLEPEEDARFEQSFRKKHSMRGWVTLVILFGGVMGILVWMMWWFLSGMPMP